MLLARQCTDSTGIEGFRLEGDDNNRRYFAVFFYLLAIPQLPNTEVKDRSGGNRPVVFPLGGQSELGTEQACYHC